MKLVEISAHPLACPQPEEASCAREPPFCGQAAATSANHQYCLKQLKHCPGKSRIPNLLHSQVLYRRLGTVRVFLSVELSFYFYYWAPVFWYQKDC